MEVCWDSVTQYGESEKCPKVQIEQFDTTPVIYILLRIIHPISILAKMLEVFEILLFMKPFRDETLLRMKSPVLPDVIRVVHRRFGGTYCPPSFCIACGCFIMVVTSLYYSLIPTMETVQCSEMASTGLYDVMLWEPETHPDFFIVTRCEVFIAIIFKAVIFWVLSLCSVFGGYRHFGGTWCHHLQGWSVWVQE
jgi:hypothetical protein